MVITDILCPNCNAPLPSVENKDNRGFVFCPYCGTQVFLDDETVRMHFDNAYEAGRDFERGRQSVSENGPNLALAQKIVNTRNQLSKIEYLREQVQKAVSASQTGGSAKKSTTFWIVTALVALVLIRVSVFFVLLIAAGGYLYYQKLNKDKQRKREEDAEKAAGIASASEQLNEAERGGYELQLPEKYMHYDVLDQLYAIVMSERAYTLQQAINCYEDDVHRKEMERIANEQLETQRRQLDIQMDMINKSAKCPYCGSTQVQAMKKGFGVGKAVAGTLIFGPAGALGGAIGANKVQRVCLSCGRKF